MVREKILQVETWFLHCNKHKNRMLWFKAGLKLGLCSLTNQLDTVQGV